MKGQQGFSLIETVIGVAILGLIGAALASSLGTSIKSITVNKKLSQAESLARTQLEYVKGQPYNASANYNTMAIPAGYNGFSYASPAVTTLDSGLQRISITVNSGSTTFTLTDYKANR